ncbi:hypothetical protein GCM10011611_23650 [Aliidongia dinghuensis]|uniref:Lipoprotein n=1 Tax=Aliidongia dinghuensis TaxID=1867774 RepID=A0A8J2YSW3_9PROT|nr:hypothetical protein [Aliidongia dinghuensis]GGF17145.1 hypothetical protein GCM10011611_23650 [Aliidongia dinghuensis]
MRVLVLLALAAVTLAACDSPYGKIPQYTSDGSISTGSHLKPTGDSQPNNVQIFDGSALDHKTGGGTGKTGG